jgi:hypothetical protein
MLQSQNRLHPRNILIYLFLEPTRLVQPTIFRGKTCQTLCWPFNLGGAPLFLGATPLLKTALEREALALLCDGETFSRFK